MDETKERRQSPIVLYVTHVNFKPTNVTEAGERLTVMDLEISDETARQIVAELSKRIESEPLVAAIRIRFAGRLVLL